MPIKRISAAACLAALEAARKAGRIENADDAVAAASNTGHGPLIACARRWGSAAWVFEGLVFNDAIKTYAIHVFGLFMMSQCTDTEPWKDMRMDRHAKKLSYLLVF